MEAVAASVDITPSRLLPTACHGPFNVPSESVGFPFEANIAAFRENGVTLVVVSVDWFYASPTLRQCILQRCAGRLAEANLFVTASHAHTSPATDPTKVGFTKVDTAYITSVENDIAARVDEILCGGSWRPARLRFTTTSCDCAMHRRLAIWQPAGVGVKRAVSLHPNPAGPRDRELCLLRVEDTRRPYGECRSNSLQIPLV
jgi:hypothetical protein